MITTKFYFAWVAIAACIVTSAYAQKNAVVKRTHEVQITTDTTKVVKRTTTKTYNDMLSETETSEEQNGKIKKTHRWNISFLGLSTSAARTESYDDDEDEYSETTVNGLTVTKSQGMTVIGPEKKPRSRYYIAFGEHYPALYFGFMGMQHNNMHIKETGSSWEWGMYPFTTGWTLNRRGTLGLSTGFGFSRSSFRFKDGNVLHVDDACRMQVGEMTDLDYTKPRLVYWSWRVPLSIEWQPKCMHNDFFVSAGLEGELRHHVKSRAHVGGDRKYVINSRRLEPNAWGGNVLIQMGWKGVGFIGRINLTDVLNRDYCDFDSQPFMVGIGVGF